MIGANADLYHARSGWLHRLDPRTKLLGVACALLLLVSLNHLGLLALALAALVLVHLSAGTPRERLAFVLRALLPVSLMAFALRAVFHPEGTTLLALGPLRLTAVGLARGAVLALRLQAMALAVFAWLFTTEPTDLVQGLVRLGLPYTWGLTLALAMRYIPAFQDTFRRVSDAQQARGLDLAGTAGLARLRRMMPMFVAMVISVLRSSESLARALEARALGAPGVRRTYLRDLRFGGRDVLASLFLVALTAGLLYLRVRHGFAAHPLDLWSGG